MPLKIKDYNIPLQTPSNKSPINYILTPINQNKPIQPIPYKT